MGIPDEINDSIRRYVKHRVPVGGFLRAVLANDLYLAVMRADIVNRMCLRDIVECVDGLPRECRGSFEAVDAWLAKKE